MKKPRKRDMGRVWLWRPCAARIEAISDVVYITEAMKVKLESSPNFIPWADGELVLVEDLEIKSKSERKRNRRKLQISV